jgi:hypothetical protein
LPAWAENRTTNKQQNEKHNQTMKTRTPFSLVILCLAAVVATGCTATLQHGKLDGGNSTPKGPLGVSSRAQNMKQRIGWGTFTLFAIPVAPVTVNGEPDKELMNQIKAAAEQSGYTVKVVDNLGEAGDTPVLTCAVETFKFRNYTWLFPLVFNWGTIKLDAAVQGPNGKTLWAKSYTGKGRGFYSFDPTVNEALTTILNQMIADLSSAEFIAGGGN